MRLGRHALMERLIERHHAALYRHALWMTGDPHLADDLVQETYHEAWKGLGRLRAERAGLAWLLTILRRRLARHLASGDALGRAEPLEIAAPETRAAGDDEDTALMLDLAAALQRLAPAQREILLLHALHGLSYREIARLLDIPIGTVMSRIARARRALETALAGPAPGGRVVPLPVGRRR